jgi:hypothetical protein
MQTQNENAGAVDPVVARSRRSIADAFTDIIARRLHYFDRVHTVNLETCTASDIVEMEKGAIDRYRNDPMFRVKVMSIVAELIQDIYA